MFCNLRINSEDSKQYKMEKGVLFKILVRELVKKNYEN